MCCWTCLSWRIWRAERPDASSSSLSLSLEESSVTGGGARLDLELLDRCPGFPLAGGAAGWPDKDRWGAGACWKVDGPADGWTASVGCGARAGACWKVDGPGGRSAVPPGGETWAGACWKVDGSAGGAVPGSEPVSVGCLWCVVPGSTAVGAGGCCVAPGSTAAGAGGWILATAAVIMSLRTAMNAGSCRVAAGLGAGRFCPPGGFCPGSSSCRSGSCTN